MNKKSIATYEEAVGYLLDIPRFTSKNTIEDTRNFLHQLGDPDRKLRILHVAGTNGKGSVCAYMRSILESAGYTTTLFTSPHLVDIRERFLIKGQMVDQASFLEAFLRIYEELDWEQLERGEGYHPTFFEYLFFMAMLLFAEAGADYCILETGLGGRLDATNAVSDKELTVITRISLDHVEYLGHTTGEIAGEKAGIMRAGTPLVYLDCDTEPTAVFVKKARELDCPCYPVSKKDYAFSQLENKTIDFLLQSQYYSYISLSLHTTARYQMENAALAVRAVEALMDQSRGQARPCTVTPEQIQQGVAACQWQGRMEEVRPECYVDGAHNEDGIRAFLEAVAGDGWQGSRTLLFTVVQDKDYGHMIEELAASGLFSRVVLAGLHNSRGMRLEELKEMFARYGKCSYQAYEDVPKALEALLARRVPEERIYAAGSLYLVGEIKRYLGDEPY